MLYDINITVTSVYIHNRMKESIEFEQKLEKL